MSKRITEIFRASLFIALAATLTSCNSRPRDPETVVVLLENSPTSLDPRIGTDAVSEHLQEILFDGLVVRDDNYNFKPALAISWSQPDLNTYIFHLRPNIHFHNNQPLTSRDVKWTFDSMRDGTVISPKANTYASIATIDTPDPLTVIFRLKHPDNILLENLATSAMGIVPYGSGKEFAQHPIGTGPFQFLSQAIDQEVVLASNQNYWQPPPRFQRIRFAVVPDSNTRTLELEKGSADISVNPTTMDTLPVLAQKPNLVIEEAPGTVLQNRSYNTRDPLLGDFRVRRAIGYAINRPLIIQTLLRGHARVAESLLPIGHWAYWQSPPNDPDAISYDPAKAEKILDSAGYPRHTDGIRFHTAIKTSTDESARLLAAVLQQQLAQVGIALDIHSNEFATFYSDVVHGAFSIYTLRWVGGNEQPSIFKYAYATTSQPPKGGNRGFYSNPELDSLVKEAEENPDQQIRKRDYAAVQKILIRDLPVLNLWAQNAIVVHTRRISRLIPNSSGSFTFLESAVLVPEPVK
jgi:peptide/nickel transport system substrate-binding protein